MLLLPAWSKQTTTRASIERVVVVKVDGLPPALVDAGVRARDPRTGKSRLPWFEHIFYERGTRVPNFYVRGTSLSAPSWSLLDTGQHMQIKGNVEYDRLTLNSYDYLNFIPFYLTNAVGQRVDMPGPQVLDDIGVSLLADLFPYETRHPSFQLFQRGVRWTTLQRGLTNRFTSRTPREVFDEWTIGLDLRELLPEQQEREIIEKLGDPTIRYLDYYTTEFDHIAHGNADAEAQLRQIQNIDAALGRLWTAITRSALGDKTALVVVSDHGINSVHGVYSQGFNLVKLLAESEAGAHHVITKRRPLLDYAVKGIYPLVPLVTSTSDESFYLKGESSDYPTAMLDFDGNERATIHLRDRRLNELQMLLQQLQRRDLKPDVRSAATEAFRSRLARDLPGRRRTRDELAEELAAVRREIARRQAALPAEQPKWTPEDWRRGINKEYVRERAAINRMVADEGRYTEYLAALSRLIEVSATGSDAADLDPRKLKIRDLIPRRSMGDSNTLHDLQNYPVGIAAGGLALDANGELDERASFRRVDYFEMLARQRVRNVVQRELGNRPIDFTGVRVPSEAWREMVARSEQTADTRFGDLAAEDVALIYGAPFRSAVVLGRRTASGELELRYLAIESLTQDADNRLTLRLATLKEGFPFRLFEDKDLNIPDSPAAAEQARRRAWLGAWHTEREWMRATHRTAYSNAVVGVHEQFVFHPLASLDATAPSLSADERLMRRFRSRQRRLVETDLFLHASDHWNFDVRGFNPGGNHGSFYRISTRATLMFAGGADTRVRRAHVIDEPYDSLDFVPTVLAFGDAGGDSIAGSTLIPVSRQAHRRALPGRVIADLFEPYTPVATTSIDAARKAGAPTAEINP